LGKRYAKRGIGLWRKMVVYKKNFNVIEDKLRKVKELEVKGKIFKIWFERFLEKGNQFKKDKLTSDHKIWLNKYY
jgi:hypothetical protein